MRVPQLFPWILWFLTETLSGQDPVLHQTFSGAAGGFRFFGFSSSGCGDVDQDGFADVIVGAPGNRLGQTGLLGQAAVFSGRTGEVLRKVPSPGFGNPFLNTASNYKGYSVDGGPDIDGDRVSDYLVGTPGERIGSVWPGGVDIFSGATGNLIRRLTGTVSGERFGYRAAFIGDINGDGVEDVAVGAPSDTCGAVPFCPFTPIPGSVKLFSGIDGSMIYQVTFSGLIEDFFGSSLARAGNLDGDGVPDFLAGGPGYCRAYSGATGQLLAQIGGGIGEGVAGVGDINGDGFDDVAIGFPLNGAGPGLTGSGQVRVYAGGIWAELYFLPGAQTGDRFGMTVGAAGDLDADGTPDILAGGPFTQPNGVYSAGSIGAYSGATGTLLFEIRGQLNHELGWSARGIGDATGDGVDDIVIGAGTAGVFPLQGGEAYIYAGPGRGTDPCAAGSVGLASGTLTNVLGVSLYGDPTPTYGLPSRRLIVPTQAQSLDLWMARPSGASGPLDYGLFATPGSVVGGPGFPLPGGLGTPCAPWNITTLPFGPNYLGDTLGLGGLLLPPATADGPGSVILSVPLGASPTTITLQGLMADPSVPAGVAVTNALEIITQ